MVDENRVGDVFGEVVFLSKKLDLLKVLYDWLLRKRMCCRRMFYLSVVIYGNSAVTLTCADSLAVFKM